jgi:hypothetical protein
MTTTANLTIEQTDEARNGLPARWTVERDGCLIGLIERYRKSGLHDNAYRASAMTPGRAFQHFDNFRGTNGLQDAAEAIASKVAV